MIDQMPQPDYLSQEAEECWDRIVAICEAEQIRIHHRPDLVEMYAVTWGLYRECVRGILAEGQVVQAILAEGTVETKRNPRMSDYHQFRNDLAKCANELGLSAKARLQIEQPGNEEAADDEPLVIRYRFDKGG